MIDFICEILIPLMISLLSLYIIPILKEKKLCDYVKIGVQAAEQIFIEQGMGKEKFEYVKNWIQSKFRISDEDIKKVIESAVYELNKI